MKTKVQIVETLKTSELVGFTEKNKTVNYELVDAEVVSVKKVVWAINHYKVATAMKVVVKDSVLGSVFFQTTSDKLYGVNRGDKISLSLTLTGVGTASERYPDPIIFAKAKTRKRDSVAVTKAATQPSGDDLSINV